MRKDDIDPFDGDPMKNFRGDSDDIVDDVVEDLLNNTEQCPYFGILMNTLFLPRPFGIIWDMDKMINFLQGRGYNIIEKHFSDPKKSNETYKLAIKPGIQISDAEESNIRNVFDSEVQDILLAWLNNL